jgi:hypothetical protein
MEIGVIVGEEETNVPTTAYVKKNGLVHQEKCT